MLRPGPSNIRHRTKVLCGGSSASSCTRREVSPLSIPKADCAEYTLAPTPHWERSDDARIWQTQIGRTRNRSHRVIYLVIGLLVAGTHRYLVAWNIPGNVLEGLAAILLWPLVAFFAVDLHAPIA